MCVLHRSLPNDSTNFFSRIIQFFLYDSAFGRILHFLCCIRPKAESYNKKKRIRLKTFVFYLFGYVFFFSVIRQKKIFLAGLVKKGWETQCCFFSSRYLVALSSSCVTLLRYSVLLHMLIGFCWSMSLHLLPSTIIRKYSKVKEKINIDLLDKFFIYIDNTWMQPGIWSPEEWSIFFQTIRTNNDAEG